MQDRGPLAYVAEFIGTFALVMFVTMVVVQFVAAPVLLGFMVIGLVHAFILSMLILTLGAVSGGHFNPAITVGMLAVRKIKPPDALIYILAQLAGGVCGALFTKAILLDEGKASNYGATLVNASVGGAFQGVLVEGLFTFFLVWAVAGLLLNPSSPRDWAAWGIGATLGLLVMVGGPLTGGSFNPARSFGPALVSGEWKDFWVYVVGPVVGGGLAAVVYNALFIERERGGRGAGPAPGVGATPASGAD